LFEGVELAIPVTDPIDGLVFRFLPRFEEVLGVYCPVY
jgi:hypothetical protein